MNDIPRDTTPAKPPNHLQQPPHGRPEIPSSAGPKLYVLCSASISDSRLDDKLSVARISFGSVLGWLRDFNDGPSGFLRKVRRGTLRRDVDTTTGKPNGRGQTELVRAAIKGNLLSDELLLEFADTDGNVQDKWDRSALHWACVEGHPQIAMLNAGLVSGTRTTSSRSISPDEIHAKPRQFHNSLWT